jgi:hypothetical protein
MAVFSNNKGWDAFFFGGFLPPAAQFFVTNPACFGQALRFTASGFKYRLIFDKNIPKGAAVLLKNSIFRSMIFLLAQNLFRSSGLKVLLSC